MTISLTVSPERYSLSTETTRAIVAQLRHWTTRVTSRILVFCVGISLGGGTALSMATTSAHGWWNLHFSELGTYTDFSGRAFNATLILTGLIIVAFAVRLHVDMRAMTTLSAWMSRVVLVLFTSLGINLLAVGVIPLNANEFLHDRAASGVTLSFLCLLILVTVRGRRFSRRLVVMTALTILVLAAVIALFATGMINLAVLEIVAFPLIIGWSSALVRCVHRDLVTGAVVTSGGDAVESIGGEHVATAAGEPVALHGERGMLVADARAAADASYAGVDVVAAAALTAKDGERRDAEWDAPVPGFSELTREARMHETVRAIKASAFATWPAAQTRPAPGAVARRACVAVDDRRTYGA